MQKMLEIFQVKSVPESGCGGLGKGGGQEGHGYGYKRATRGDPGSDGMFCILTEVVETQTYPRDKTAKN